MTTTICTGWHPKGWDEYAKNFCTSFDKYWPEEVRLVCYMEETVEIPRGERFSVWDCNGAFAFILKYDDKPQFCGKVLGNKHPVEPSAKEKKNDYTFRYDAVKFCRQLFIPEHAASYLPDGHILAWFDSDVVTFKEVPNGFIEGMLGKNDICYLGRNGYHSEIGFWAVRINDHTRSFLKSLADTYRTGDIFGLKEWHSAFVFDHCLKKHGKGKIKNLSPNGRGHVWFQTPLGDYTDHLKGPRKALGRSPERTKGT